MNLIEGAFPYFTLPFILALVFVPICKRIGFNLEIYALENKRTVHHGKIVRVGGLAIYCAFMVAMAVFMDADSTLNAILLGSSVVFLGGLIDDMFNIKPIVKVLFQLVAALIVIYFGKIGLTELSLPFGITLNLGALGLLVSIVWIVGISNAINLIDGLDGLCAGTSFIVCCVIGLLGFFMGRRDICILCLVLCGSTLGFLPYNFNPASIFMGDCGALWLGFLLACFSLLGFKTASFITIVLPILALFIPISDTMLAIIRRKLRGQSISQADREHLHHILMYRMHFGHRNTVIALYLITTLYGIAAIVTYFNEGIGLILVLILMVIFELFVEYTGMVNIRFHPLISCYNVLFGRFKKVMTMPQKLQLEQEENSGVEVNHD